MQMKKDLLRLCSDPQFFLGGVGWKFGLLGLVSGYKNFA